MSALQASFLCRPSPSSAPLLHPRRRPPPPAAFFGPRRAGIPAAASVGVSSPGSLRLLVLVPRSLPLEEAEYAAPERAAEGKESGADSWRTESVAEVAQAGQSPRAEHEEAAEDGGVGVQEGEAVNGADESARKVGEQSDWSLAAVWVGARGVVSQVFDGLPADWFRWWPWRQQRMLERLMADADANPKDAAKQSALLAELNKHSPESVIKRFEERNRAGDSLGVAEYIRALVMTNALAYYLPDEQSGRPSRLPMLVHYAFDSDILWEACVHIGTGGRFI